MSCSFPIKSVSSYTHLAHYVWGRKSDGVPVEEGGECGCGWPRSDTGSTEMHKFVSNGPVPCTERFLSELRAGESIRLGAGKAPERCGCVLHNDAAVAV